MPQLFKIGSYVFYFWANENNPLEPVYVHIAEGKPFPDATKIWITISGHCVDANNKSQIPDRILGRLVQVIEANCEQIKSQWVEMFGEITYFC